MDPNQPDTDERDRVAPPTTMTLDGVAEISASVVAGATSASEVVDAALIRAERSQKDLNAFISIDREGAMRAAARIDDRVAGGDHPGPLAGVPVAVKDLIDQAGLPNTRGSSAPPAIPTETATSVRRVEEAGGIVIGRTGLHEFAFGFSSENHWFGPVRNPWDPTLSPGGSSGGSAAAVGAGVTPVALGTDTGGSVRVPAALCGIVGLKVTHGRVPLRGVFPLAESLDTVGPLARTVADCAVLYSVIAGDDDTDPWSVPRHVDHPGSPASLPGLRVGVPRPWVDFPLSTAQETGWADFLSSLAAIGAEVVDVDAPTLGPSADMTAGLFYETALVHRKRYMSNPGQYGPEVRDRVEAALATTGEDFVEALRWRRATRAAALRAFQRVDVLVTPSVATVHKVIGEPLVRLGDEETHYIKALSTFATPVNHIGMPALAVPLPGDDRPPASMQIIGPPWSEARLLEVGLALETEGIVETRRPPHWRPGVIDPDEG